MRSNSSWSSSGRPSSPPLEHSMAAAHEIKTAQLPPVSAAIHAEIGLRATLDRKHENGGRLVAVQPAHGRNHLVLEALPRLGNEHDL